MLVHDLLRRSVDRADGRLAVVGPAGTAAYGAVAGDAARVAHVLMQSGVRRGDRVVLALENSPRWMAAFFGILQAGAVVVPLAPGQKNDRLQFAVRDCSPSACIADAASARALDTSGPGVCPIFVEASKTGTAAAPHVFHLQDAMQQAPASAPQVRVIDVDPAAIIYTSGSTGAPRGVVLSHLNLVSNAASIVQYLGLTARDRAMVVLPFHYVYGLSLLTTHVMAAGSLALDNRFAFPNAVLETMQQQEATGFAGVPSTFALLLHRSSVAGMAFPSLRYVTQAGGPMAPALLQQWLRVMPDVPFYVMYGATEASARLAYLDPSELRARLGSIGKAIPNVELAIIGADGEPVAPGETGEIVARGSNIMMGYWNRPQETSAAIGPYGFRTGDLAKADQDGYLYIVGRRQDMLKIGGERVGAKEIEDVLHEHAAVYEAAVVGIGHELLGEVPVAFVALRPHEAAAAEDIIAFCRTRLADHKIPARVVFQADLPKSTAGKIDKPALRQMLADAVPAPFSGR